MCVRSVGLVITALSIAATFAGCSRKNSETSVSLAIERWHNINQDDVQRFFTEQEVFWSDVEVLFAASKKRGNAEAFHVLLRIRSYTDGMIGEQMPVVSDVVERWPEMSRQVIESNERLLEYFGHLLPEE